MINLKTYKFHFHATIGKLTLNTSVQCNLSASWKRSNESAKGEPVPLESGVAYFNQTLNLPVNMYLDTTTNLFQEKKSQFSFTLHTTKGDKSAGVVIVDLSTMLNNKIQSTEDNYKLDKCPDKQAKVWIQITYQSLGQITGVDQRSTLLPNIQTNPSIASFHRFSQDNIAKSSDLNIIQTEFKKNDLEKSSLKIDKMIKSPKAEDSSKKQIQKLTNQVTSLKAEMLKSKSIQLKLENEIIQMRKEKQYQDIELQLTKKKLIEAYQELEQTVYKYL